MFHFDPPFLSVSIAARSSAQVLLRLFCIFGKINSAYRKVDTAVIVFCGLWNGAGLFYALALASNDARALRFAMLFGGCSTLFAYAVEVRRGSIGKLKTWAE